MPLNRAVGSVKRACATWWRENARPSGWLRQRERGAVAVLIAAVVIPALIGFGTLAIGRGYYGYRKLLLEQTVQSAALAAGNNLATYYSTGSPSTVVAAAQAFASANMPAARYGTVVPSSNVVLGNWSGGAFTSLASSGGTTPNAVKVTGLNTAANGNAVALFLGGFFGKPSADVTFSAIAGAGTGTGQMFNTIIINDMSDSFSDEISNQKAADLAILNCVKGSTGTTSQFGITFVNGHSSTYQALEPAAANYSALQTKINAITTCTGSEDPNCGTGSNISSGMYSAIQQFSSLSSTSKKNIVIITDGVPNANSITYSAADGVTCTRNCTDAQLQAGAQTQAALAKAAGISISTIYYSGDTDSVQDQAIYTSYLATLVTGSGTALVAPTPAQISTAYSGVCSTIPSALVSVQ
jgi:Flp pilus assembly protein TadG